MSEDFLVNEKKQSGRITILTILQYTVLISVVLYFGKTLFIPLSISMLISFVLFPICKWLEIKGMNRSVAIAIALSLLTVLLSLIVVIFLWQISSFASEWQDIKLKLIEASDKLSLYVAANFNFSSEEQNIWMKNIATSSGGDVLPFLSSTAYSLSVTFVLVILIPVFSALILFYRNLFLHVLKGIFPSEKMENIRDILNETVHSYYNFIKGMMLVYLIVGTLNSIGLLILGIPHAILFGFIASVLTFIPYVGIMVASLLPISVAWITYDSIWYPIGVIAIFAFVQYLEANIIFPFAVSSRLNINTLVTLIVIFIGGILWGAAGMILFIPFVGIIKMIADRTESLKTLALLLGTSEQRIVKPKK